jgi:hypothetical protein
VQSRGLSNFTEKATQVDDKWFVTLTHKLDFPPVTGSGKKVTDARAAASKEFLDLRISHTIPKAAPRKLSYTIFNAEEDSLIAERGARIGFDVEWDKLIPGPTVVQVAIEGASFLWVRGKDNTPPDWMKKILEQQTITKYGFATKQDKARLEIVGVKIKGDVDVQPMVVEHGYGNAGLEQAAEIFIGVPSWKDEKVKLSFHSGITWSDLSLQQKEYVSMDALLSFFLGDYLTLANRVEEKSFGTNSEKLAVAAVLPLIKQGMPLSSPLLNGIWSFGSTRMVSQVLTLGEIYWHEDDEWQHVVRVISTTKRGSTVELVGQHKRGPNEEWRGQKSD